MVSPVDSYFISINSILVSEYDEPALIELSGHVSKDRPEISIGIVIGYSDNKGNSIG